MMGMSLRYEKNNNNNKMSKIIGVLMVVTKVPEHEMTMFFFIFTFSSWTQQGVVTWIVK